MGALLAEMDKHPAGRPPNNPLHDERDLPPRLSEIGISRKQSSRWQLEASVPEEAGGLLEEEKRAAKERQGTRTDLTRPGGGSGGEAVDKAGQAVGVGGGSGRVTGASRATTTTTPRQGKEGCRPAQGSQRGGARRPAPDSEGPPGR